MRVIHHTNNFYSSSQTFIIDLITNLDVDLEKQLILSHRIQKTVDFCDVIDVGFDRSFLSSLILRSRQLIGVEPNLNKKKAYSSTKKFRPDVIHCHFGISAFYSYLIQEAYKDFIPMLVSFHGYDVFESANLRSNYIDVIKRLVSRKDVHFTAPSKYLKNVAMELFHIPDEKLTVVYNGFNSSLFHTSPLKIQSKALRISNVSRFVDWKGQSFLIDVISILKFKYKLDVVCDFIGDGPTLELCKSKSQDLNLSENCIFHKNLPHADVSEVIRKSHIYVHSAITLENYQTETFGVAVLEAVALGRPVVYFSSGGIPEIFDGFTSKYYIAIAERDIDSMAERVFDLSKDVFCKPESVTADINLVSSKITNKFSSKNCKDQIMECYRSLF